MYTQYPGVEFVSLYGKGGYHPVLIDDVFCNRYRVINKLGYGTYGTVWLVEDLLLKRFAALKVMVANVSGHTSYEIDVLITSRLKVPTEIIVVSSPSSWALVWAALDL
jgi:serine/threonine-protein kinase SRPK3